MKLDDALLNIEVNPESYEVKADGELRIDKGFTNDTAILFVLMLM